MTPDTDPIDPSAELPEVSCDETTAYLNATTLDYLSGGIPLKTLRAAQRLGIRIGHA